MADRGEVKIKEAQLAKLINFWESAYSEIAESLVTASQAEKIRRAATMRQIEAILTDLGRDIDSWIDGNIPQYYFDGSNIALEDLRNLGLKPVAGMSTIDRQAIEALVLDTKLGFADSMTTIGRSASQILSSAQKQQLQLRIATGRVTGETRKTVSETVQRTLREQGVTALVDKGGRKWDLPTYANMLVRTKAVEARNTGLANRMLTNGYDLVQVSDHNSEHPACAEFEGKILSISGSVAPGTQLPGGYVVYATLEQAKEAGLFHPNCQHAIYAFDPDIAAITSAYANPYNYRTPVATDPANDLQKGNVKIGNLSFKINQKEAEIIKLAGVTFGKGEGYTPKQKKGLNGFYSPSKRELHVLLTDEVKATRTFYHELGHAIDYGGSLTTKGNPTTKWREAMRTEALPIVVDRINNSGLFKNLTKEQVETIAKVGQVKVGQYSYTGLRKKDHTYMRSANEVFADAYAQYRTKATEFRKYAPQAYKFFKELGL